MVCKNCGKDFEGKFCPFCGTPAENKVKCKNCGQEVDGSLAFCPNCGQKLSEVSDIRGAQDTYTVADAIQSGKVTGRDFIYRIAAMVVLLIGCIAATAYGFTTEFPDGMGMMATMSGVASLIALFFAVILLILAVVSIKKGVGRKLMKGLFIVSLIALFYGMFFCTMVPALSSSSGPVRPDVFKIILLVAVFVLSITLFALGIGGKFDFKKPPLTASHKRTSYIVSGISVVLAIVFALLPLINIFGDPLKNADKIKLGMSESEVLSIMGKEDSSEGGTYVWYDRETAKIIKKLEALEEDAMEGDLDAIMEAAELAEKLESMHSKSVTVEFDYEGAEEIYYNADTQNLNKTVKTESSAKLAQLSTPVFTELTFEVNAYYTDGSWTKKFDSGIVAEMSLDIDSENVTVDWEYRFSADIKNTGTLTQNISVWESDYRFDVLEVYDEQFGEEDLKDESQDVLRDYVALCEKYGIESTWADWYLDDSENN